MPLLHRPVIVEEPVYTLNKMYIAFIKSIHTSYTLPCKRNKTVATRLLQDYDMVI